MTDSSENGAGRLGGSILVVGAATEELISEVRALESLAETTLAPPAEALGALARTDPGVFIVEDRDRALLAEAAAPRPAETPEPPRCRPRPGSGRNTRRSPARSAGTAGACSRSSRAAADRHPSGHAVVPSALLLLDARDWARRR